MAIVTVELTMEEKYILNQMDNYYKRLLNCISYSGRSNNYLNLIKIYKNNEEFVSRYWVLDERRRSLEDRIQKRIRPLVQTEKISLEVENRNYAPSKAKELTYGKSGLYLIGNTVFNPITGETFYWIKVGKSKDLKNRLDTYNCYNPMLWKQEYLFLPYNEVDRAETKCHHFLKKISMATPDHANEWHLISAENYLKICNEGFKYFGF